VPQEHRPLWWLLLLRLGCLMAWLPLLTAPSWLLLLVLLAYCCVVRLNPD
jgi:hypothetical protein